MDDVRIAAVCMHSAPYKIEENLEQIRSFAFKASDRHAGIICFPELCITGYTLRRPGNAYTAKDTATVIKELVQIAQAARIVLLAGLVEVQEACSRPFISHVAVGPAGLIGLYRKTHLSTAEKEVYQAGGSIEVYAHGGITFGLQLCYEAHFPEISTAESLMGADLIFIPHASPRGTPEEKLDSWLRHLPARAFDNGLFVVACNQVGATVEGYSFPGVAAILGPDGRVMTSYTGDDPEIIYADLKANALSEVRENRMKYFLPNRRPDLYKIIAKGCQG